MSERPIVKYLPSVEGLEPRRLPSGLVAADAPAEALARRAAVQARIESRAAEPQAAKPTSGFLVYRITNPNRFNTVLKPPFQQVYVQQEPPTPGQTYNILSIVVRNGTAQTIDASSGFEVRFPQQTYDTPVLTGNQEWKPGEWIVFYVLTKKYYPLPSQVTSGFEFNLDGARSVAVPGPSAIFQRIKYDPAKFPGMLDKITAFGVGAQGGRGVKYGLPVTNIYEFVSAQTDRIDFGGYF
ncbi:hypothetical protein [Paludisphaera mucosa]|uniref:Uncharacterized protein n=1 Tax=Paludisphaera mucosa TaxID=3030827 RepID=A0ABT6FAL6_9BACT|nr:hypothetical protein [Paludisphaera mucosa]MDG3004617.1 hypothetical protein [Paludisphaera mucosa]